MIDLTEKNVYFHENRDRFIVYILILYMYSVEFTKFLYHGFSKKIPWKQLPEITHK